jgi:hypothetical protein
MNLRELFVGALTLRTATFTQLRERSDVFFQGFVVLFVAAWIAGAFGATQTLAARAVPPPSEDAVLAQVQAALAQAQMPSANRVMVEGYAVNVVSMIYELAQLPPQAGEWGRPLALLLDWLGTFLSAPFAFGFVGWTLFAGLLFGAVALWFLGGRGTLKQILGLTALAAAPQAFTAIPALLATLATLTGVSAFTALNGLFGLILALWSAAIYVQATAVAQHFSVGRAIASIAIGLMLLAAIVLLGILFVAFAIGRVVSAL